MKYLYFLINVIKIRKEQLRKEKETCYICCICFSMLLLVYVILSTIYLKTLHDMYKTAGKVID